MKKPGLSNFRFTFLGMALLCFVSFSCSKPVPADAAKSDSNPNSTNNAWGYTGIGGGGAMFNPSVSPFDPDFAFVSCDMTGSFVTYDGGKSWRMFNLRGAVGFFVFDPNDSNTVYANSVALFKSTNKGKTWKAIYPGAGLLKGIVSKGDHADEVAVTSDSLLHEVVALAVDPEYSEKLFAVISVNKIPAFYTSGDGGLTWKMEKELKGKPKNIFVSPSSPAENRAIFIAGENSVIVRENGKWQTNAAPNGVKRLTAFDGGYDKAVDKFIIYTISGLSYFNSEGDVSGIFYSENGGKTWENRQNGLVNFGQKGADLPEWRTIATSALNPATVYVSYNRLHVNADTTAIGVAKSTDYGKTWKLVWKDCLTENSQFSSSNFQSGWLNERFGPSWGENPFAIGVSPVNADICYATDFGRTIKTANGGKTWEQVYTDKIENGGWRSRGLEVTTSYKISFDPFNSNHVFICTTDIGLIESCDAGKSWNSATKNNGIPDEWINSTYWLAFDPEIKDKAWAVMSGTHDLPRPKMFRKNGTKFFKGGILETTDGGKNWKPVSSEIGETAFTHVLIDPVSEKTRRTLYACAFGKGVYKSVDGGKTWVKKNKGILGDEPFAWRIERRETDGVLFLIVSRRSDNGSIGNEKDGALYKSVDGAETWTPVVLPQGTNGPTSFIADTEHQGHLLLSAWGRPTGGRFSADIGGGIFKSTDDGKTWQSVLQHDQHIHDITFDPRNKAYFACGFEGSAYRSDDGGNTWTRLQGYNFKWGKRVDFDPINPDRIYIITFGGGVWTGQANGDNTAIEDIVN